MSREKMEKKFIKDFKENESISSYFAVFEKNSRLTKTDKNYLDITLGDRSGKINAKIWDNADDFQNKFEVGDAVAVKGQIVTYNNEFQINVSNIRRVQAEMDKLYGFELSDIIPTTSKNIDEMWERIQEAIASIGNDHVREVTKRIYTKYEDRIKTHPASMILHHAFRGGLLEHVSEMTVIAETFCRVYRSVERDLVIAGVLLHDIGKLVELEPGIATTYTDAGNLIGHLVLGRDLLRDEILKMDGFPDLLRLKLEHIILSHQGKYEWQSPREPEFPEALLVYYADEIDTRMQQMKMAIESDSQEGDWTSRNNYFHRPIYKNPSK